MAENNLFIHALARYCDVLWEYNTTTQRILIHHDKIAPFLVGKSRSVDALTEFFREKCKLDISDYNWSHYLNRGYLDHFQSSGKTAEHFQLRFKANDSGLMWYNITVETDAPDTILISGRNIYDEVKNASLYKSVNFSFDNILNIDAETGTYVVVHSLRWPNAPMEEFGYNSQTERLFSKYLVAEDAKYVFDGMRLDAIVNALEQQDEYELFFRMINERGELSYKKAVFTYVDDQKRFITYARLDISNIVNRYERQIELIRKENYRDTLTGAHNRNFYEMKLKYCSISSGVAVIDVDDFKLCNDTYGHTLGDRALLMIANAIQHFMEPQDMLIRLGGDEFLLIMPDADEKRFEDTLQKIQQKIEALSIKGADGPKITVSTGGVMARDEICDTAVGRADRLMYRAKNQKNTFFTERMAAEVPEADPGKTPGEAREKILIVDDSALNRMVLREMLQGDFDLLEAADGATCLSMLEDGKSSISLILLDIVMPAMSGFDVLAELNRLEITDDLPVIIITADDSAQNLRRAYDLGASDYISRPFDANIVRRRILNTIKLYAKQRRLLSIATRETRKQERSNRMMIDILSRVIGLKSGESVPHIEHMRKITSIMLEQLMLMTDRYSLNLQTCAIMATASALHDIGKMGIDSKIINKAGKLTAEEFEQIKQHTVIGENLLKSLDEYADEPLLKISAEICRWHHERYDGKGYPDGLKGEEIPISAQVVSIADAFDALVSERSYKKAYTHEKAFEMIEQGECGVFNPLLVQCLKSVRRRLLDEVYNPQIR